MLAVLATQGGGSPYASLVAFSATDDLTSIFFSTARATRKYANLMMNASVAMVIDTRMNQTADFTDAAAVTALGEVKESTGHEREEHLRIYLGKHPYTKEFVESPTTAFLRVRVRTYIMVSGFQNVQELHIGE